MEIYPDQSGNQSIDKYPTYEKWLEGYFYPTLKLCITVLKSKGTMCIMLGNYHKKLSGEIYDLVGDFENFMNRQKNITRTGMYFLKNRLSPLKNNDKLRGEILFIYEFLN
jgi:DNA modification methylase